MTALQGWIHHNPVDPRHLKAAIWGVWRDLTSEKPTEPPERDEPQLMGRGLERC